jgi:hypothetical protein
VTARRPASADFSKDPVMRYIALHPTEQRFPSKDKRLLPPDEKQ